MNFLFGLYNDLLNRHTNHHLLAIVFDETILCHQQLHLC